MKKNQNNSKPKKTTVDATTAEANVPIAPLPKAVIEAIMDDLTPLLECPARALITLAMKLADLKQELPKEIWTALFDQGWLSMSPQTAHRLVKVGRNSFMRDPANLYHLSINVGVLVALAHLPADKLRFGTETGDVFSDMTLGDANKFIRLHKGIQNEVVHSDDNEGYDSLLDVVLHGGGDVIEKCSPANKRRLISICTDLIRMAKA